MRVAGIGVLVLLAGCALPTVELGDFVPVRQLLAETAGMPYQCARLRPDQDSCNVVTTLRRVGARYEQKSQVAISLGETTYMEISERLVERNGTICVVTEQITTVFVGGRPPFEMLEGFDGVTPPAPPEVPVCYAYYRGVEGGYVSAVLDETGRLDPASAYVVEFLAERPQLQAVGLF